MILHSHGLSGARTTYRYCVAAVVAAPELTIYTLSRLTPAIYVSALHQKEMLLSPWSTEMGPRLLSPLTSLPLHQQEEGSRSQRSNTICILKM